VVRGAFEPGINGYPNYDVSRDGARFLMVKPTTRRDPPLQLALVPGWRAELEARAQAAVRR
jgi:hypothetical protein